MYLIRGIKTNKDSFISTIDKSRAPVEKGNERMQELFDRDLAA